MLLRWKHAVVLGYKLEKGRKEKWLVLDGMQMLIDKLRKKRNLTGFPPFTGCTVTLSLPMSTISPSTYPSVASGAQTFLLSIVFCNKMKNLEQNRILFHKRWEAFWIYKLSQFHLPTRVPVSNKIIDAKTVDCYQTEKPISWMMD